MKRGSRQLYRKMLLVYTAVLVSVVILLVLYFISGSRQQAGETNQEYMKLAGKEARDYILQSSGDTEHIMSGLYNSYTELNDLCRYLSDSIEDYMKYRLDTYDGSSSVSYSGIEDFWAKMFGSYGQLEKIRVYSRKQEMLTEYAADGTNHREKLSAREAEVFRMGGGQGENSLCFRKELKDPVTLEVIGWMEIAFSTDKFADIVGFYERPRLMIYDEQDSILYTSEDGESWDISGGVSELERQKGVYLWEENAPACRIFTWLGRKEANHIPTARFLTIIALAVVLTALGEMGIRFYLSGVMKRLDTIVSGMEKVTTGNLDLRIEAGSGGDELDIIADSFNKMCQDLDAYIKKSYLAEIEQKNAEMAALQSQINPHFLYNTLEAIRMKAICNGDREVGRMLYSMAAMFQSQLKAADVILLAQELHYSKKYMELFEYRYHEKFRWEVVCDEKWLQTPVIKFIIQPVLENYFAHGIRLESDSNFIRIEAREEEGFMKIIVEDNGRGMTPEEMEAKNRALRADEFDSHKSMGLANVNRRLRAVYGEECGLFLSHGVFGGLRVELRFYREENKTAV